MVGESRKVDSQLLGPPPGVATTFGCIGRANPIKVGAACAFGTEIAVLVRCPSVLASCCESGELRDVTPHRTAIVFLSYHGLWSRVSVISGEPGASGVTLRAVFSRRMLAVINLEEGRDVQVRLCAFDLGGCGFEVNS